MKIIFLNGPPNCGKDTAADAIADCADNETVTIRKSFAEILKRATHESLGLDVPWDYYEGAIKDKPNKAFFGKTPRQAYIAHSELYMKPVYGQDIFARLLLRNIKRMLQCYGNWNDTIIAISDCGFIEEYEYFRNEFGVENLLLLRIHRPDCSFENDSRSYIFPLNGNIYDVRNYGEKELFQEYVLSYTNNWFKK